MSSTFSLSSALKQQGVVAPFGSRKRKMPTTNNLKRSVHFGKASVHTYEMVHPEEKAYVWYNPNQLSNLRESDIRQNHHAEGTLKKSSLSQRRHSRRNHNSNIESDSLTWRGLEDIQQGFCRVSKSRQYTRAIVNLYRTQVKEGYVNPEELKVVARNLSRTELCIARQNGITDAEDAAYDKKEERRIRDSFEEPKRGKKKAKRSISSLIKKACSSAVRITATQ